MASQNPPEPRRPLLILVLDDNHLSRQNIASEIELQMKILPGFAQSREDAYEIMEESGVDVVICDLFIAEIDGLQFLQESHLRFPQTHIIIVYDDFDDDSTPPLNLLDSGALATIPKSEVRSTLIDVLRILDSAR